MSICGLDTCRLDVNYFSTKFAWGGYSSTAKDITVCVTTPLCDICVCFLHNFILSFLTEWSVCVCCGLCCVNRLGVWCVLAQGPWSRTFPPAKESGSSQAPDVPNWTEDTAGKEHLSTCQAAT